MGAAKHTVGASKYMRPSKDTEASKHTGGIQTYGGHPNVWSHMDTPLVRQSILSLCCICTAGIQTYRGASKHIRVSKHMGDIQTYIGASKHVGVAKHTGGIQTHVVVSKHIGTSKHMGQAKHTGGIPACLPIPQSGFCH